MEMMTAMTLLNASEGETYSIKDVNTGDDDMKEFLFRLGCYSGEPRTVITKKRRHSIVAIKDGRYSLDNNICEAIII